MNYVPEVSCCHDCHFEFEEKELFKYLPPKAARKLLREHKALRRAGFPHNAVLAHSKREMIWYRRYAPVALVRRVEADHAVLLKGK